MLLILKDSLTAVPQLFQRARSFLNPILNPSLGRSIRRS